MTLPQVWNIFHQGDPPSPGTRTFGSRLEAHVWRMTQLEKIARRKAEAEAREKRENVARWRKARRGY